MRTARLRSLVAETAIEVKRDDVPTLAAAVAFKIVLALFPALLAVVAIFSLVSSPEDIGRLLDRVSRIAPAEATAFLEQPLNRLVAEDGRAGGAAIIGVAGGIWAATSAAVTLLRALSRAYDFEEQRKFLTQRATALVVTLALFLALITIFVLLVTGGVLESSVLERLALVTEAETTLAVVLTVGRYLLSVLVLMLLFAFIYWIGPDRDQRPSWHWISFGAAFGVIAWLVTSGLFGFYTQRFGNFTDPGSVYGVFGNAIVFMLWLQLSMIALLVGAELNQVLRRERVRKVDAGDVAGFGGDPPAAVDDAHVPRAATEIPASEPAPRTWTVGSAAGAAVAIIGLAGVIGLLRRRSRE